MCIIFFLGNEICTLFKYEISFMFVLGYFLAQIAFRYMGNCSFFFPPNIIHIYVYRQIVVFMKIKVQGMVEKLAT